MGLTCVTVVFSVAVSFIHHQGNMGRPVPSYLRNVRDAIKSCLGFWTKTKVRFTSKSHSPSTTETTPDLKTPLRQSFCSASSINFNSAHQECKNCFHCLEYQNVHAVGNGLFHARIKSNNFSNCHHYSSTVSSSGEGNKVTAIGMRRNMTHPIEHSSPLVHSKRKKENSQKENHEEISRKIDQILDKQEQMLKSKDDSVNREWHELAEVIDRALFWIYVCVTLVITVTILLLVPLGKTVTL